MPTIVDHALVVIVGVVAPGVGVLRARSLLRSMKGGESASRSGVYVQTMMAQWLMLGLVVGVWMWFDRPLVVLGLGAPEGAAFWATAVIVAASLAVFAGQIRSVRRDAAAAARLREQVARLEPILPRSPRELRLFLALGVSAGVCEEVFYRGYLLWWGQAIGAPIWAAVAISAALFGAAHAYQGADGALRVFGLGVVFGAIAWLTGSIWIPIVAHGLIDIAAGLASYIALQRAEAGASDEAGSV